ncbi:hypothetical protein AB0F15_18120 [Amycolatopsis sp. NPDC026612]|uniref:hypothetical protein n=1 Tax=Amycolatopsis sp. NPDC026612 TaxID=3155466 RepID=UPI0033DDE2E5
MREDGTRSVRAAKAVVTALGLVLVSLGIAATGALLLFVASARGDRDWAGSGTTVTTFAVAAGWTVVAGASAIRVSRRPRSRTIWLAGLSCVALGAVPTAVVAVDLLLLLPR